MNKSLVYILVFLVISILIFIQGPIPQNLEYHNFSDQRSFGLMSNFFDVLSNLPFLFVGIAGMIFVRKNYSKLPFSLSWFFVFFGVFLVAPGSAYYHLAPDNPRLVWDRLPMTIGFMSLVSAMVAPKLKIIKEAPFLFLLLFFGIFSIWYWVQFQDLRVYILVQLAPIVLVLLMSFLEKSLKEYRKYLLLAFVFYIFAKITESYDDEIFSIFFLSGHSLKHVLAAVSVVSFYYMCKKSVLIQNKL